MTQDMTLAMSFGRKHFYARLMKKRDSAAKMEWILRSVWATSAERTRAKQWLLDHRWQQFQVDAIAQGSR